VDEFVEDGGREEESEPELRGVEINVFAFCSGDAGHLLDGTEPVSSVAVLEMRGYFSHEFEVVVVDFDVGLAGISVNARQYISRFEVGG
jgi:hypothetical protein